MIIENCQEIILIINWIPTVNYRKFKPVKRDQFWTTFFFLIALTPISTSTYLSSLWELLERHVTEGSTIPLSLHQDISHSFDVLLSIVWCVTFYCIISTSDGVILISSCSKADSGISGRAVFFIISKNTNSCSGRAFGTASSIEAFLVTVGL